MKQQPCCSRLKSSLRSSEEALKRLARLEAYHAQKGHSTAKLAEQIKAQRADVARCKARIVEHEAEHCDDADCRIAAHYELRA